MHQRSQVTIGIDLGGTSTRVGVYDQEMNPLANYSMKTRVSDGPQSCVAEMAGIIHSLLTKLKIPATEVLGIGIGSPGPINLRSGVLGILPNLPGWDNFPLRHCLAEATGISTVLESDANAAAIAEWRLGAGRETGLDSMAMITLGTGVGSGLILQGRIWHGMYGMGGEVGHTTVEPEGLVCGCGTRGCLEMYASANGLRRMATSIAQSSEGSVQLRRLLDHPEGIAPHRLSQLAQEAGDPSALLVFDRLGSYLGIGIANLISTLDLPMIVIGGGVAKSWSLFAPSLFRSVYDYSVVYRLAAPTQLEKLETDRTYIRPAVLGEAAGLMGAALLPRLTDQDLKAKMSRIPAMVESM